MTMNQEATAGRSFVARTLPWLVAGAALAVYLLTLNHWISFQNMPEVAKASGLSWQSELFGPAYHAAIYPLHWLPTRWIPLGLNLFAAVCGALTVGLLARSVALLPQDRTHEQRERETSAASLLTVPLAWLPPVLAALVCGLQLTFWEDSTNGTPEIFNLLLLAYVVRVLLEYRLDGRETWLLRAALVYGMSMTDDWLALGLFPAFLTAVIWLRGLSFFNLQFLGRMILFGLLGLSLYLLLPLVANLSQYDPVTFWQALKIDLLAQKYMILVFPKKVLLLMSLTSLLPVLLISFRWASYFGDNSKLGVALATGIFHLVHGFFLAVCLWVTLDPPFSPRNFVPKTSGMNLPFLPFYYLSSLSIGYFGGYFLLVFRRVAARNRRPSKINVYLDRFATGIVVALAVAVPAILIFKNFPQIRNMNGSLLRDFARLSVEGLPKSGALLADDPRHSFLIRSWLIKTGRDQDFVIADTYALASPGYSRYLRATYGEKWPVNPDAKRELAYDSAAIIDLMQQLAKRAELYYLHPSFGGYFEYFYLEPHGLVYRLRNYVPGMLVPPPLPPLVVAENEAFWARAESETLPAILAFTKPRDPQRKLAWLDKFEEALHLSQDQCAEAVAAGALYSRPLTHWGKEIQKTGDLEKGAAHFALARDLNADNVVARINLLFNKTFRAGGQNTVEMPKNVQDFFGEKDRTWEQVLGKYGPFEQPDLTYSQGFAFLQARFYRQAAEAFERVQAFAPDDLQSRLCLGQLNLLATKPDRTIQLLQVIHENPDRFKLSSSNRTDILCLEARAIYLKGEPDRAEALLESAAAAAPDDSYLLAKITGVYSDRGAYSNALANIIRQLKLDPKNTDVLLNKGAITIYLNAFPEAIATMTELLTLQTNKPEALLNRGIAYLRSDQLDSAREDYETLQRQFPMVPQVYYGLGEIAYRRKETNAAIQHYESYLSNSIPGNAESKFIEERLKELKGEKKPAKP